SMIAMLISNDSGKKMVAISFWIVALLLACGTSCSREATQDGVVKRYHSNGNILAEATYKKGRKHGLSRTWHDNGQLASEARFENDSLVGYSVSYYANGNK